MARIANFSGAMCQAEQAIISMVRRKGFECLLPQKGSTLVVLPKFTGFTNKEENVVTYEKLINGTLVDGASQINAIKGSSTTQVMIKGERNDGI